ncbi:hypothetical protein SAMN05421759_10832 [Roseivivax lentus]|uniref:Uncharacterized protein n=1 Tax=Roseivivax lentus TaxID=633194 RepID=A0A1N7NF26_9RHOB|nr:hypothetical protein [Roseivivax lentus]SIS96957.1 hypothetical protein SAMN05421759_10832 [Roseivivax lentus]
MTLTSKLTVLTLTAALAAGSAIAKGHDQGAGPNGSPETPAGQNAGAETASAAQTLGKGKSTDGGPSGKSGDANAQD